MTQKFQNWFQEVMKDAAAAAEKTKRHSHKTRTEESANNPQKADGKMPCQCSVKEQRPKDRKGFLRRRQEIRTENLESCGNKPGKQEQGGLHDVLSQSFHGFPSSSVSVIKL